MSREWRLYLDDMIGSCRKIANYAQNVDFAAFAKHGMVYDGIVWNLQVLGEACRNIPEDVRRRYPDVPWPRIAALRNVLTHGYFGLEDETLWDIVQTKIAPLREQLEHVRREG